MSSSSCFLVARDIATNDFEIKKGFLSLKEADLYTTNYHNSKDLAKGIWETDIIPSQEIDFFMVTPFIHNGQRKLEIDDVLFSDSKEIRMIDNHERELNALNHFIDKIELSNGFLDEVQSFLYEPIKNYLLDDSLNRTISYRDIRKVVLSFRSNNDTKNKDLYRLLLERKLLSKFDDDYNEKQLSFEFKKEKEEPDKIVEIISTFKNISEGFFTIKDGVVYISNNIYTTKENLKLLDSLLDQRLGFILCAYAKHKNNFEEDKKQLLKDAELKIIELLSSDMRLLNNTYILTKILNTNIHELLGDDYGYQYKK